MILELKAEVASWKAKAQKYWKWIVALRARKDELLAQVNDLEQELAAAQADNDVATLHARIARLRNRLDGMKEKVANMAADIQDD